MQEYRYAWLLACAALLAGCTSDPNAPVNQVFPIPQLDAAFGEPHAPPPAASAGLDYTHHPGYLPAYPPYSGYQ